MGSMAHSPAYQRFIDSMKIDYEKWHDGIGYDLDAIDEMTEDERKDLTTLLKGRDDWRDVEALARIQSPAADDSLVEQLQSSKIDQRLAAMEELHAKGKLPDIDRHLAKALPHAVTYGGLTRALLLAEQHPTDRVKQALLWCARHHKENAVHCAAMLYYLAGISKEPFDWNHRPFFLRFVETDEKARIEAFEELCRAIKVDPSDINRPGKK
jgi:hypothetical protein